MRDARPTFPTPTDRRGMTLMELMVVLAIVGGLMGAAIYGMGALTASDLRDEAMRLTSVIKYSWNQSAMNNAQYRLVIDIDNNTYHTEVTDAPVVAEEVTQEDTEGMLPEELEEEQERMEAEATSLTSEQTDPFGVHRKPTYERVQDATLEARSLSNGVEFYKVLTNHQEKPFESGRAAISFFPDGFQEPAIIVLRRDNDFYSMVTEPLTGRVKIYSREIDRPEGFGEVESDD